MDDDYNKTYQVTSKAKHTAKIMFSFANICVKMKSIVSLNVTS